MLMIGLKNCSKCEALKEKWTKEGKAFDYMDFKDLSLIAQRKISKNFRDESGGISFPVIIENREAFKIES